MTLTYRILLSLCAPVFLGALLLRMLRGQETFRDIRQRLGLARIRTQSPVIWLHGASNGELMAAKTVINTLADGFLGAHIVVTCNTVSARHMVDSWTLPDVTAQLAPIDFVWSLRRFVRQTDPKAFVLLEGDFWPNRQSVLKMYGVPSVLIGGRVSQKSARVWAKFKGLSHPLFGTFDAIWPQSDAAQLRLVQLGARTEVMHPVANFKSHYQAPETDAHGDFVRSRTWLAASTHEGEDDMLLHAHKLAQRTLPDLRLILAPRHPKRRAKIAAMARAHGLSCTSRSLEEPQNADVYIADTFGEMPLWYSTCYASFVAGSLVAKGGHTPFEPIAHNSVVLTGPHTENFASVYRALADASACVHASTAEEIAAALLDLNDPKTAHAYCARAQSVAKSLNSAQIDAAKLKKTLENLAFGAESAIQPENEK